MKKLGKLTKPASSPPCAKERDSHLPALDHAAFTSQSCSNGSYAFTPGRMSFQETPCVEVTDTVGAGDSFTGAFCAAILKGLPVTEAHKLATEVSAYVYTQSEAMPTQPKEIIGKANR